MKNGATISPLNCSVSSSLIALATLCPIKLVLSSLPGQSIDIFSGRRACARDGLTNTGVIAASHAPHVSYTRPFHIIADDSSRFYRRHTPKIAERK